MPSRSVTVPDAATLPLVAVAGPTGSGKSDLALAIAHRFDGEIVNCDSLQVYRHFDIGTAKLAPSEWCSIPHHLIDFLNPDELFTAGEYARVARETIQAISGRGKLPILAGGTGFYLRALLDGLFAGPSRDDSLRDRLSRREARRPGSLHRLLAHFDPATGRKIHPHDVPKVTRALEVCLLTRRPVSELFQQGRDALQGYRVLKLGLLPDRDALYERVDARCAAMFDRGLVDEVRHIIELGYGPESKPFESVGYKQALQYVQGELNLRDAIFYAQRATRQYAKRQLTWFRREAGLVWLKGFADTPGIREHALELVAAFVGQAGNLRRIDGAPEASGI
jgi:tRNA dimethylallyltransferase